MRIFEMQKGQSANTAFFCRKYLCFTEPLSDLYSLRNTTLWDISLEEPYNEV